MEVVSNGPIPVRPHYWADPVDQAIQIYKKIFQNDPIPPIPKTLLKETNKQYSRNLHGIAYIDPRLTLNFLSYHAQRLRAEGCPSFEYDAWDHFMEHFGDKPVIKSGWVLFKKAIIPRPEDSYGKLERVVAARGYEMAEPAVACTLLFMHLIQTNGGNLLGEDTFTVCKKILYPTGKLAMPVAVGFDEDDGDINIVLDALEHFKEGDDKIGALGVRWFSS